MNRFVDLYKKKLNSVDDWFKLRKRIENGEKYFETHDKEKEKEAYEHLEAMGLASFEFELHNGWIPELLTREELYAYAKKHGVNAKLIDPPDEWWEIMKDYKNEVEQKA